MNDFKSIIEQYSALLPVGTSVSYTEATRRAGEFLMVLAKITNIRHILSNEKVKLLTVQTATYAQEMAKGVGKTVTQDKIAAEASEAYVYAREALETLDNDLVYLKAYYDIFTNAAVFYRQMSRGEIV